METLPPFETIVPGRVLPSYDIVQPLVSETEDTGELKPVVTDSVSTSENINLSQYEVAAVGAVEPIGIFPNQVYFDHNYVLPDAVEPIGMVPNQVYFDHNYVLPDVFNAGNAGGMEPNVVNNDYYQVANNDCYQMANNENNYVLADISGASNSVQELYPTEFNENQETPLDLSMAPRTVPIAADSEVNAWRLIEAAVARNVVNEFNEEDWSMLNAWVNTAARDL